MELHFLFINNYFKKSFQFNFILQLAINQNMLINKKQLRNSRIRTSFKHYNNMHPSEKKNIPFRRLVISRTKRGQNMCHTEPNECLTQSKIQFNPSKFLQTKSSVSSKHKQIIKKQTSIKDFVRNINSFTSIDKQSLNKLSKKKNKTIVPQQLDTIKTRRIKTEMKQQNSEKQYRYAIQNIENKVQQLIKNKLNKLLPKQSKHKRFKSEQITQQFSDNHLTSLNNKVYNSTKLEKIIPKDIGKNEQLDKLVKQIQSLKINTRNSHGQIEMLDRKINILEKVIAENSCESQIVKNAYFNVITDKKKLIRSVSYQPKNDLKLTKPTNLHSSKNVTYQTQSLSNYKAPQPQDYKIFKYQHPQFHRNIQPLPRSIYDRQFLSYKNFRAQNFSCKKSDKLQSGKDYRQKYSIYHTDFQPCSAQKIDIRELDSYKDKFKDLEIYYFPEKKNYIEISNKFVRSMRQKETQQKQPKILTQGLKIPQFIVSSENRRQYKGQQGFSSSIKHKKLSNLKYSYKSFVHA